MEQGYGVVTGCKTVREAIDTVLRGNDIDLDLEQEYVYKFRNVLTEEETRYRFDQDGNLTQLPL